MPINGIEQPQLLMINNTLRLRKYDGVFDFALPWYQNKETLRLVNGDELPMDKARIQRMYAYLNQHGELYFIEALEGTAFVPIGDVTWWEQDMPIVIGNFSYRGKGIGSLVIKRLIERAKALQYTALYVDEIYDYNLGSRKCFEKAGFVAYDKTENGRKYRLAIPACL